MQTHRLLFSTALAAAILGLPPAVALAQLAPYTLQQHRARQEIRLEEERAKLDFDANFYPYLEGCVEDPVTGELPPCGEWVANGQAAALLCELEARAREAPGNQTLEPGEDAHLRAIIQAIQATFDPQNPAITNVHSRRDAAMRAAYILQRFPDHDWSDETRNQAFQLFKWAPWRTADLLDGALSNNELNQMAMRLFAAEVFDDADLRQRARWEFRRAVDGFVRRGVGEAFAPHYAGRVLTELTLAWHTTDAVVQPWVERLLTAHLAAIAQVYLPGGGIGPPHQRDRDGALEDPDPTRTGTHLIQQLNMLVFDPALEASLPQPGELRFSKTYNPVMLATDYRVPELIRSMFLDKGAGYTFRALTGFPWSSQNGLDPDDLDVQLRGYRSTAWQGWNPSHPRSDRDTGTTDLLTSAIQSAMLPSGKAALGAHYGSGSSRSPSWSGYIRNPGVPGGFSILYHFQPRHGEVAGEGIPPDPWDPLIQDPTWKWERKTPYRRLMHHRTVLALYDTSVPAGPHPPPTDSEGKPEKAHQDPDLDYAMAHLPAFMAPCPGGDWWAGEVDAAFMAYRPVGILDGPPQEFPASEDAEAFTYLKLQGPISGYIAEIADGHADVAAYCQDLEGRPYHADLTSAEQAVLKLSEVPNAEGGTGDMKLELEPERRWIGDAGGPSIADPTYFDHGLLDSRETGGGPWLAWDTSAFTLTVSRDLDPLYGTGHELAETLVLDFGDPTEPTAPYALAAAPRQNLDDPVVLEWKHGWDDQAIVEYDVHRNGSVLATQPASLDQKESYTDSDLCTQAPTLDVARYHLRARDDDPPDPGGSIATHPVAIAVLGDLTPPSTPTGVQGQFVGNPILSWNASTDNWGIYAYWITRTEVGSGEQSTAGTTNTYWWDPDAESGKSYDYQVQAIDPCPRWSAPSEEVRIDVP